MWSRHTRIITWIIIDSLKRGPQYAFKISMFMCPAVHTISHSWLRSSSIHEPSDPPYRVCKVCFWRGFKAPFGQLAWRKQSFNTHLGLCVCKVCEAEQRSELITARSSVKKALHCTRFEVPARVSLGQTTKRGRPVRAATRGVLSPITTSANMW